MQQPKKILTPVDFSKRSEIAVEYTAMVAALADAELVLMANVSHPERAALKDFAAAESMSVEEAAQAAIQRIIVGSAPNANSSILLRYQASAADAILEAATEEEADLIVLSSHGRSGMTRWMLGSVTEKVSRNAEVPVIIVPARGQ